MANHERDDFNRIIENAMDKVFGMYSRGEEVDPETGVITKWSKKDDDTHYTRDDRYPSGTPSRMIRESNYTDYLHRSNTLGYSQEDFGLLAGYDIRNQDTTFNFRIFSYDDRANTSFNADYTQEGILTKFKVELRLRSQDKEDEEGEVVFESDKESIRIKSPDQHLQELLDIYQLKGPEIFKAHMAYDTERSSLDNSGTVPQFVLSEDLQNKGYTQDDIDLVLERVQEPIINHLHSPFISHELSEDDLENVRSFLSTITARRIISGFDTRDKNEELQSLIEPLQKPRLFPIEGRYFMALSSFVDRYYLEMERLGRFSAEFIPQSDSPNTYTFNVNTIGAGEEKPRQLHTQAIQSGQHSRYENLLYTVEQNGNQKTLTVRNIFNPDNDKRIFTFPQEFDAREFQKAIDTEDSSAWIKGLDYINVDFTHI